MSKKIGKYGLMDIVNLMLLFMISFFTLYPFLNLLAVSLNEGLDTIKGGITFYPRIFTLENYKEVFKNPMIFNSFAISVMRTCIGVVTALLITGLFAYALSKTYLVGRKYIKIYIIITMYISGGIIPYYMVIKMLHLTNNFLVYIIPALFSVWNTIVMMIYFQGIPSSVEESAYIDGANDYVVFFKIVFPMSAPIIAVISLYIGVYHWNDFFVAYLFVTKEKLQPLQTILVRIINENTITEKDIFSLDYLDRKVTLESVKMATMMVAVVPIIMVYPSIQKYFVKGLHLGAIKE